MKVYCLCSIPCLFTILYDLEFSRMLNFRKMLKFHKGFIFEEKRLNCKYSENKTPVKIKHFTVLRILTNRVLTRPKGLITHLVIIIPVSAMNMIMIGIKC